MAFDKIKQASPAAIELIRLCSFLMPDAIPEEILTESASFFDPPLQSAVTNRDIFNGTLALLLNYSLLSRERASLTLSMHRLIQAVIKDEMTEEKQAYWSQMTLRIISKAFPFDEPAPWPKSLRYILHGLLAIEYIDQWDILPLEAINLFNTIGTYFYRRGQYSEAELFYQRTLATMEHLLGPEHPGTLTGLNNLAVLYYIQVKYEQAEPLYQRALAAQERLLGSEHLDTLQSLNNLALLYADQGKHEQAEPLYQRALAARERLLGPEHLDTLQSLNNLALLYYTQGKYEQAEPLYQRALAAFEKVFGPDHPYSSRTRQNYALLQQKLLSHEE